MEKYGVNQLRQMFLDFFESKGHLVMKSFSLVPQHDKSLLLINAGMAPLKPYFTGAEVYFLEDCYGKIRTEPAQRDVPELL